MPEQAPPGK